MGRGSKSGKRRKVALNVKIPGNWKEFLSCSQNKTEFFPMISEHMVATADLPPRKVLFATVRDECASTDKEADLDVISPCSHEEADTRMFLHMFSAALSGHKKILIQANDTDVMVLGMRAFALKMGVIEELWITYSAGTKFYDCACEGRKPGFAVFFLFISKIATSTFPPRANYYNNK